MKLSLLLLGHIVASVNGATYANLTMPELFGAMLINTRHNLRLNSLSLEQLLEGADALSKKCLIIQS